MVKVVGGACPRVTLGGMALFALSGFLVAFLMWGEGTAAQQVQLRTERAALLLERAALEAERTLTTSQFNQAQRALLLERETRLELEKILASVQSELGRTQDQLAFFEDLLPPGPQGALDIRAVNVEQHAEGLHYRVLLMRSGKVTTHFVGVLQFVATGYCRQAGTAAEQTVILQPLLAKPSAPNEAVLGAQRPYEPAQQAEVQQSESQLAKTQEGEAQQTEAQQAALRLDFSQFQRGQGLLALPPEFLPKSVTVRVLVGDIVLASRVVAL